MKTIRLVSLLLAMALLFSCAAAENTDRVMATVNGEDLLYTQYAPYENQYLEAFANYGYDAQDEASRAYIQDIALTAAIQDMLTRQDMKATGCYDFDAETESWIKEQGNAAYQTALADMGELLRSQLGLDEATEMSAYAQAYADIRGVSAEDYINVYRTQMAFAQYYNVLLGEDAVSDADVQSAYDKRITDDKARYENDAAAFETALYSGSEVWYKPMGYRSILQILLKADGDTNEACLASVQTTVDEIYAKLESGDSFESLIASYGTDTAFDDPAFLTVGYQVHRDSIVWEEAFINACFSDEMAAPGCWSQPVVSDMGVHILYYLCDSPCGPVELTDDLRNALGYSLYQELCTEAVQKRVNELAETAEVVIQ